MKAWRRKWKSLEEDQSFSWTLLRAYAFPPAGVCAFRCLEGCARHPVELVAGTGRKFCELGRFACRSRKSGKVCLFQALLISADVASQAEFWGPKLSNHLLLRPSTLAAGRDTWRQLAKG